MPGMSGKARRCLICVAVVLGTVALAARAGGDESVSGKGQDTSPVVTGRVVDSDGKPATRISGRVVDKGGEPADGVMIRVAFEGRVGGCIGNSAIPPCQSSCETRFGLTDAEGRFVFESLKPGWWEISAFEFYEYKHHFVRRRGAPGQDIEGVEFILTRKTVPVEGRIVDADGTPVAGAAVTLLRALPPSETETDAAGEFRFSGVLSGKFLLTVEHPDQGWIEQDVEIGEAARLELQMPRGTLVQGRVLGPDGALVEDAILNIGERSLDIAPDGTFQITLPAGEHEILAESSEPEAKLRRRLTVRGEPIDLELRLARPGTVRGRLTGLPPGMTGRVRLQENPDELRGTDEHGGYSLEGIAPGAWTLVASDDNDRMFERPIHVGDGEVVTVDFDFPPLSSVRGRVLDPAGRPTAGTAVIFEQGDREIRAATDAEGIFVAWPREGSWSIRAQHQGFGPAVATVEVPGDAPVELPDLRLARLIAVSGRVLGADPKAVVASVAAQTEDGLTGGWSEVDQDNRFRLPNLWPGTWLLTTDIDGRPVHTTFQIPPGATDMELDLTFAEGQTAEEAEEVP